MQNTMRIAPETGKKALPKRINFTHANLTAARCPAGKDRIWLYDAKQPGLTLMVTAAGSKGFYLLKKKDGSYVRERVGGFPEMHLDDARDAIARMIGDWAGQGIDPRERRRKERAHITMDELLQHYLANHAKPRKRHWEEDEAQFNRYMTGWKGRKINSIQHADIATLHAKIGKNNGHHAANRLIALLHKMFNVAKKTCGIDKNPADGIDKFPETSRERFAGPDEMPRLLAAIEAEIDPFNHFFLLALLTGGRRSNLQSMRWDEINLATGTWTIPGDKAKAGKPIVVPLVDPAIAVLQDRLAGRKNESPWVFPSYGKDGHIAEPKMARKRILTRAKITDLRIHDLRRTFGSWQAAQGTSLQVIGKAMGHRNVATTAIYARLNLDPVRASVRAATNAMLASQTPQATNNP